MQNIPDHKLDDLFREKSENARIAFNPQAWEKMDKKLSEAAVRKEILKRWIFFSSLFILMMMTPFVWNYLDEHKNEVYASSILLAQKNNKKGSFSSQKIGHNYNAGSTEEQKDIENSSKEIQASTSAESDEAIEENDVLDKSQETEGAPLNHSINKQQAKVVLEAGEKDISYSEKENIISIQNKKSNANLKSLSEKSKLKGGENRDYDDENPVFSNEATELERSNALTKNSNLNYNKNSAQSLKASKNRDKERATDQIRSTSTSKTVLIAKSDEIENPQNANKVKTDSDNDASKVKEGVRPLDLQKRNNDGTEQDLNYNSNELFNAGREQSLLFLKSKGSDSEYNMKPLLTALTFNPRSSSWKINDKDKAEKEKSNKEPEEKKSFESKLRFSVQFSPDISSVVKIELNRPSYNTGFSLEYFISDKFSVTASFLKSRKVYKATPDSYAFPSGGYAYQPNRIEGKCTVYDIPINVRYFYFTGKKFRTYASGGISSYIMKKESYKYEYSTWNKTYDYPKGNNHLFSVVNISIGAEYKLGQRVTIGLEPFMKVPLAGVGEGKIKLNTIGTFLSINYTLYKK